jgi:hypothetical protein
MDEDINLKNGIRIQMDQLDFDVAQETADEIAAGEPESPLKNAFDTTISLVFGVGCLFTLG